MTRPYNFSPGPATLPEAVLQQAADEMLDWHGSGMSVMEMSHRGRDYGPIIEQTEADLRELLAIPAHYKVLFLQGGAQAQNAVIPLNLAALKPQRQMDYVVTGSWSQKSAQEAAKYGDAQVVADAASTHAGAESGYTHIPAPTTWRLRPEASYLHLCSNETVHGVEFHELPDLSALGSQAPLLIDFSSHVLSRPLDWSRVALAYGGAQKNIGPAGLTLVVLREDLLGHALPICPSVFDYRLQAANQSMLNTPPTYAIYLAGLTLQWIKAQREPVGQGQAELHGLAAVEARNIAKARLLYDCIDGSQLYENRVDPACRSRMNVPFFLRDESRNAAFLEGAAARGLLQLKGHKMVGGMRASLYNAMPLAGVQALVEWMREFERQS
ncbi:phosphoserine aminotransferase [Serpentinimonas raichei]|uniref:Phosphoserine aminotransferase n=1 Tax=Serpentinimonas raichei TaxID=1458425 RepID=A0A060NQV0_9BURK|nr:3-phosphoserine/phosphohydroxythreonine transaminase [Serpentinimonas raichei]BAO81284.1 phosphoserine aminotransferase [Serpentinimonas raichei]